jgi:hypothetical protein
MLETRMPSVSTRTRRLDAPLRPVARPSSAATSALRGRAASRPVFEGNAALETAPERSETRPSPLPRQSRLGRSEMRLMGLATTCTAIVCGLLLLYLAITRRRRGFSCARTSSRMRACGPSGTGCRAAIM